MNNFWTNILKYPRFFVSSLIGLILIIITPFLKLFKIPKIRILIFIVITLMIILFYLILSKMIGY